jgi:hypothetical protein
MAVFDGNMAEVRRLVEAGADVNARHYQDTPLHWAVKMESDRVNLFIISYLAKHGADVNAKDRVGNTPLHLTSAFGYLPATKRLLDLGADPTLPDDMNQTPVDKARGDVKAFFERKANAKGLAMVSTMVKPRGEPIPYDLVREIGKNLNVKPSRFTPQSAKGRKTRVRKTKRRLTRRRK